MRKCCTFNKNLFINVFMTISINDFDDKGDLFPKMLRQYR